MVTFLIRFNRHVLFSDKYGPKVSLFFDYDADHVTQMNSLPWGDTHRRWNGRSWELDATPKALRLLNEIAVLPDELVKIVIPETSDNKQITAVITGNEARLIGEADLPELLLGKLNAALTVRCGEEDQFLVRLFDPVVATFPVSLLSDAVEVLEKSGYNVRVSVMT